MNRYDTEFIKSYISENKDTIESVSCGMKEDWNFTAQTVYENGEFCQKFNWNSKSIKVAGISGSIWATPVMEVYFKDGSTLLVPCFFDDGYNAKDSEILQAKMYAMRTGGKEYE